jgi:hypothetical protein
MSAFDRKQRFDQRGQVAALALTMFNGGATEFQGFSPSGGTVGLVTYFGPWGFSGGSFDTVLTPTPLPAALPLFVTGIGGLGLLGWRRKRKSVAGTVA